MENERKNTNGSLKGVSAYPHGASRSVWVVRWEIIQAWKASNSIENEWRNKRIEDGVRQVLQDALHEYVSRRGITEQTALFATSREQLKPLVKEIGPQAQERSQFSERSREQVLLQKAVNILKTLLLNMADTEDDRNPESGEIYRDVVHGALFLDEVIDAGIISATYTTDGITDLIKDVKKQEAKTTDEPSAQ